MFLYSLFVSDQTNDAVFVAFGMEIVKLTNIQAAEAAHILVSMLDNELPQFIADIVGRTFIFQLKMHLSQNLLLMLGGDHSADDVMHGENPVESKVSDGDNKTDVELPYGGGRLASTKPVDGPNENGKKKPRLA
ncbi:hypothetical protein HID58_075928 [Brassica napus]|uniref:Uncharacterized protein n=1 Tax=Brassica napus TaxID=3708 RepID=A0ABQ7YL90_BRANA|nr:hypothetical protein HID58_075928 [Brassica napus]